MGIYSLTADDSTEAAALESMAREEPPPAYCTATWLVYTFTSFSYLVVLVIELIIPTDNHAVQLATPHAPPMLRESSELLTPTDNPSTHEVHCRASAFLRCWAWGPPLPRRVRSPRLHC